MNRSHIDLIHDPEGRNQCPVDSRATQRALSVPSTCSQSSANAHQPLPFSRRHCPLYHSTPQTCRVSFQTATTWPTTVEAVHWASQLAAKDALSARVPSHLSTRSLATTPPVCPHHNRATTSRWRRPRRPARIQRTPAAPGAGVDLDTWLDSTATAVQQMHEGDAGVEGVDQQHDPMFESPDRVNHEADHGGRYSAYTTPCCECHARTTTEDSGDNTGDSTPGSSTPRPGRSIISAKAEDGPGEEEEEEESQRAYRAGAGQPSGSVSASGPFASARTAYRLVVEDITQDACLAAASRRPSTSSSSDSSDSASSVKKAEAPEEVVPESSNR
jgi:hypothetical protein